MLKKMQKYGRCMGVPGMVSPHIFYDGKDHYPDSHGLCPSCYRLALHQFQNQLQQMQRIGDAQQVRLSG